MENQLLIVLVVFVVGVVLSGRVSPQPQIIYIQAEPQAQAGVGCLLPLVFVGFVLLLWFAGH